jgi:uncharacterized membrane protein HdeD (DUF308 family)
MANNFSPPARRAARNRLQAYVLIILGIICLLAAWLLSPDRFHFSRYTNFAHFPFYPDPFHYPIGLLAFGIGLLIAFFFNPRRLAVLTWMVLLLGIQIYLLFTNYIPSNQALSTFALAIGIGLIGVAIVSILGLVRRWPFAAAIFVIIVGILDYLFAAHILSTFWMSFILSLWLPGIGLLIFGIIFLITNSLATS